MLTVVVLAPKNIARLLAEDTKGRTIFKNQIGNPFPRLQQEKKEAVIHLCVQELEPDPHVADIIIILSANNLSASGSFIMSAEYLWLRLCTAIPELENKKQYIIMGNGHASGDQYRYSGHLAR